MSRRAFIRFALPDHESTQLMEKLAEKAGGGYLSGYLGGPNDGHITVDFDAATSDDEVLDQVEAALTTARRAVSVSDWARDKGAIRWPEMVVSAFELVPVANKGRSTRTIAGNAA